MIKQVQFKGKYTLEKLKKLERFSNVREVRGTGLLIGIDMINSTFAKEIITNEMRKNGVNVLPEGRSIMFNPAYIVSEPQIDHFVDTLEVILNKVE